MVLFGSPHKDGHTAKILNRVLDLCEGSNVHIVNAYEKNAKPCIDCKVCANAEKCIYDDLEDVDSLFKTCDILVIASPVYNNSFPAPLKAILDRTQRYYNAKFKLKIDLPIEKIKKALLILTHGKKSFAYEKEIKKQITPIFHLLNVSEFKYINVSETDNENFSVDKFYSKSKNRIVNIIDSLYSNL